MSYALDGIKKKNPIANKDCCIGQHEAHELRDGDKAKWLGKGEFYSPRPPSSRLNKKKNQFN